MEFEKTQTRFKADNGKVYTSVIIVPEENFEVHEEGLWLRNGGGLSRYFHEHVPYKYGDNLVVPKGYVGVFQDPAKPETDLPSPTNE